MKSCRINLGGIRASACLPSSSIWAQVITGYSAGISANAHPYDGYLWFTENGLSQVVRITPLEVVTEFGAAVSPGADVLGITAGPENKASPRPS